MIYHLKAYNHKMNPVKTIFKSDIALPSFGRPPSHYLVGGVKCHFTKYHNTGHFVIRVKLTAKITHLWQNDVSKNFMEFDWSQWLFMV